jgi:hypothetical protein
MCSRNFSPSSHRSSARAEDDVTTNGACLSVTKSREHFWKRDEQLCSSSSSSIADPIALLVNHPDDRRDRIAPLKGTPFLPRRRVLVFPLLFPMEASNQLNSA